MFIEVNSPEPVELMESIPSNSKPVPSNRASAEPMLLISSTQNNTVNYFDELDLQVEATDDN